MKTSKRVLSLVLAAIMLVTTFSIAMPMMKVEANAAITLGGITQTRVVSDYQTKYAEYANRFFGGNGKSEATNFVIPGLSSSDDYTPQGMTYWKAKDWILISAYDASGAGKNSVIYALDGKSTEFVALFNVLNEDGSVNTSHGGGIAASEYNFYYADTGSKISYVPLSEMDVAPGTVKSIKLKGSINCAGEMNNAYTSYCCYDEGVLWTGNFYFDSSSYDYAQPANASYNSMLLGYRLVGDSSEEEWAYLNGKYKNLLEVTVPSGTGSANGSNLSWNAYKSGDFVDVVGSITAPTATVGEFSPSFGSFYLTEGKKYIIQYVTNVHPLQCDFYMFAPNGGGHMDVKLAKDLKITQMADGRWHCSLEFTAGLRSEGADSAWPSTQSTNGTYTGTYTIRYDQDSILAGEERNFAFTDVCITEASDHLLDLDNDTRLGYRGNHAGYEGNPTYCVALDNDLNMVQYAMVDNGRIYISRSWSRNDSGNHVRQLVVGEIDLNSQGTIPLTINGKTRYCHYVDDTKMTKFGGSYKNNTADERNQMLFMGEALCVMEGYLYMFAESAAWTYNGKDSSSYCKEPIDVIWKIDQFAIMDELRETESEKSLHYEQVTDISQIKNTDNDLLNTDEYIIVYESEEKDPVTQKNILYALDAFGGHNGNKMPKNDNAMSENANGYNVGIVGHPITEYQIVDRKLYLNNPEKDDVENIRWKFSGTENGKFALHNTSLYYAKYKSLYFNGIQTFMSSGSQNGILVDIYPNFDYEAYITMDGYFLWCNDGQKSYDDAANDYYQDKNYTYTEQPGTFHADGLNTLSTINMRNVINGQVTDFGHGRFYIYKRVLDPYVEKEMSKVYTDSKVELQPDGTYTIDLETYAIGPTHYTVLPEQRPTDFILVLDASGSMETNYDTGMTGWKRWSSTNTLSLEKAAGSSSAAKDYDKEYSGNIYYRHADGQYYKLKCMTHYVNKEWFTTYIKVKLWYTDANGQNYYLMSNGSIQTSEPSWDSCVEIGGTSEGERAGKTIYTGVHYSPDHSLTRLDVMKASVDALVDTIATEANASGLKHRVSVVQYGSTAGESYYNTGMYKNDGSFVQYNGSNSISAADYTSVFFDVTNASNLQKLKYTVISNVESAEGKDADTYANHGYDMANNIVDNYSGGYLADGDRSACIIMITDGIPGQGANDGNKETVANDAINQAYKAKQNGAYSFTVQMGDASGDWSYMSTYIDALSSEYIEAKSLTDLGERNANEIDYAMSVPTSSFNLNSLAKDMFVQVTANSRMALTQLGTASILRQTLSDKFYAPVGSASVQYLFADGYYDGLGRISFRNETDATASGVSGTATAATDADGNQYYKYLDVTGFDYKNYYISKTHEGGKKLIIRITGVLPRMTSIDGTTELSHVNSDVSDSSWTGIYQNEAMRDKKVAFKGFPNASFSIPKYTYVLDYGINMLDTDVNGTLKSVSEELSAQRDENGNLAYKRVSENGLVSITDNSLDLIYKSTPTNYADSGYCLIQRDNGTYDWFEIEVVPASNVLYEESHMKNGSAGAVSWTKDGTTKTAYQSLTNEYTDVYGYDDVYADGTNSHSYGSADKATVSTTAKRSTTKTFDFIGEGIDLISACGKNTGIVIVKISGGSLTKAKSYIVDTFYNDPAYLNGDDLICQTPIVSFTGDYGTYTVEATATYLSTAAALKGKATGTTTKGKLEGTKGVPVDDAELATMLAELGMEDIANTDIELVWFDDNSILNGGTGAKGNVRTARDGSTTKTLDCYLDGFRVYHPMKHANDDYIETEKDATYINVIDALKKNQIGSDTDMTTIDTLAYVIGSLTDGESLSFANYQNVGPQNELYLKPGAGDALVLMLGNVSATSRVMLGLRAVTGTAKVTIGSGTKARTFNINSATEMYYDITDCIEVEETTGIATITIENTGSGILAVNNIKTTGNVTATSVVGEDALEYAIAAMAAPAQRAEVVNGVVTPVTDDDATEPDDGNTSIPGGDDNTSGDNNGTTESGSFLEQLIAMIIEIIMSLFNFLPVGEVM